MNRLLMIVNHAHPTESLCSKIWMYRLNWFIKIYEIEVMLDFFNQSQKNYFFFNHPFEILKDRESEEVASEVGRLKACFIVRFKPGNAQKCMS